MTTRIIQAMWISFAVAIVYFWGRVAMNVARWMGWI